MRLPQKKIILAFFCSTTLHLCLLSKSNYLEIKSIKKHELSIVLLKNTSSNQTTEKTVYREEHKNKQPETNNKEHQDSTESNQKNNQVSSAYLKQPLEIDPVIASVYQKIKIKIWINQFGKADHIELLDQEIDENSRKIIEQALYAAEFEPAMQNDKKIDSIISGEIYLIE